jgi:hypothetical protein
MTYRRALLVALLLAAGCGGSGDRVRKTCERAAKASCGVLARCHAVVSGITLTDALCDSVVADVTDDCVAEDDGSISSFSDAMIDACISAYATYPCDNVCNQVAQDPPACQALVDSPNDTYITCE